MANVKVYEIAASAALNSEKLFSPDKRHFYWNDKKFAQMGIGEKVFFINRSRGFSLFTEIDRANINASQAGSSTLFTDDGTDFTVDGAFSKFVRFKVIEERKLNSNWTWKTLGSAESTYLARENSNAFDLNTIKNNIERVGQLLVVYNEGERLSNQLLQECKARLENLAGNIPSVVTPSDVSPQQPLPPGGEMRQIIQTINNRGFVFEPWQIAAYVTALRTKPFVILAGVSGTGKSKLPKLIAGATGGISRLIPVRPDWTDSSEVLGYCSLNEKFRPGQLLEFVREAARQPDKHHICIMDEMNLARVEHYFAEVLSRVEDRAPVSNGGFASKPLLNMGLEGEGSEWSGYGLPPNLAIVGTVNMDESAHGFSRKVLDRAFTIELSDIDLTRWGANSVEEIASSPWPVEKWYPRAIQLGQIADLSTEEGNAVNKVIQTLTEINRFLVHAQLQVGYRTRDEIALFLLHAREFESSFVTTEGKRVDPLDLVLQMKILPRIAGGSAPVRRVVLNLLGWAYTGKAFHEEDDARAVIENWDVSGRLGFIENARYPRTAARLCLMWDRLVSEGFTSFWL